MLVYGLLFGFASLLGMAATHPHLTNAYVRGMFSDGVLRGLLLVYLNALVIPNMAAWVLFPAMGTCVGLSGGAFSVCALSYTHFPSRTSLSIGPAGPLVPPFPAPSPVYFAFVLVPAVAVLLGGMAAAKRSDAATPMEGAGVGALAGVVFALFALGTILLASVALKIRGNVGAVSQLFEVRAGPEIWIGTLLALVWGVAGGAVGGLVRAAYGPRRSSGSTGWQPAPPPGPAPPSRPPTP